jgi:hypothetical protein
MNETKKHTCGWKVAWGAICGREAPPGQRCRYHHDMRCGCGKPATTDCGRVIGNFVCGAPKCSEYPQGPNCHRH